MNLIIDVGNTRVKSAVFEGGELIHNEIFRIDSFEVSIFEILKNFKCSHGIISSVGNLKKGQIDEIKAKIELLELDSLTKVPFKNSYATPKSLGVDRIALMVAAFSRYPQKNVLVIDAGTCITYDFINSKGEYLGGAISPGLKMRYRSLNAQTHKLPLLEPIVNPKLTGDSTDASIHSGIINGAISEIDGAIDQYREKNGDLTVVLTGGDLKFLANSIKNTIFANPNFLLEGLNKILTYNLL